MTPRWLMPLILILVVVGIGAWFLNKSSLSNTPTPTPGLVDTEPKPVSKDDLITVYSPLSNASIASPLTVTGQARGTWYFEAQFPVILYDANGVMLAQVPATAQGEWMTENYVPFVATLSFARPTTPTGTLVLQKDNPSGLPQHDNEIRIPIVFGATGFETIPVKLYYYDSSRDQGPGGAQCSKKGLVSLNRAIPKTQTPLTDSIKLLLQGEISAIEKSAGITTDFPLSGLTLDKATINAQSLATLTFSDPQNKTSGGACRANILRLQIEETAKQFASVKSVNILPGTLFQP